MLGGNHWVRRALPWSVKRVFRDSLKQGRQVHLYSGTPGRTVWAQSRQTNRPSLWAIIGLKSMPAMQWGQRMIRIVSVGNWRSCTGQRKLARGIPDAMPSDPDENQRIVGSQRGYRTGTRAEISASGADSRAGRVRASALNTASRWNRTHLQIGAEVPTLSAYDGCVDNGLLIALDFAPSPQLSHQGVMGSAVRASQVLSLNSPTSAPSWERQSVLIS